MGFIRLYIEKISSSDLRRIIGNVSSLTGMQVANSILPLVTIPYIVRVIGPANYGVISFAQAFATYFLLIVNYGFDFSASRKISVLRDNKDKVSEIFWSVLFGKLILFIISSAIFLIIIILTPQIQDNLGVMIISFLVIAGYVIFPTWLFQGIEKLGLTALCNFIVKLIFTVGIFVFLRKATDYLLIPILLSCGQFLAGLIALLYARKKFVNNFKIPSIYSIYYNLREGWGVFLSVVFINLYIASNTVFLGFFAPKENVGYFSGGAKIILSVHSLIIIPIIQASYPYSSRLVSEGVEKISSYLKKLVAVVLGISIPTALALFFGAGIIVRIILGVQYEQSVPVVHLLAFFPLISGLSSVFGIQGILAMKRDRLFLLIVSTGFILNLILNLTLTPLYFELGCSVAWIVTEVYVTLGLYIALHSSGIRINGFAKLISLIKRSIR